MTKLKTLDRYDGPAEVLIGDEQAGSARVVLRLDREVFTTPTFDGDAEVEGLTSWGGRLSASGDLMFRLVAEADSGTKIRLPDGRVGDVFLKSTTTGEVQGSGTCPFGPSS